MNERSRRVGCFEVSKLVEIIVSLMLKNKKRERTEVRPLISSIYPPAIKDSAIYLHCRF